MALYLLRFSYTPESWRALIEQPEDRREAIRHALELLGGTFHELWFAFGSHDAYMLIEANEPTTPAALAAFDVSSGIVHSMETTVLLTVEDMLEALARAKGLSAEVRPPGGS